ncbi:hypothetical protein [uncultured Tenacibaculum sp.]|nr:hypothetical protein [uncultured Tenacibaculum sp.]
MKQYLQHSITYHNQFRSPKNDLLLCGGEAGFIYKKEIDDGNIS